MKIEGFAIKPHEFKHSIEIQRKTPGRDEDGLPIDDNWATLFKTRAKVLNVPVKEVLELRKIGSEMDKTFYIRVRKDKEVTEADRILYKGKYYDISCQPNDIQDSGIYLEIKAKLIK